MNRPPQANWRRDPNSISFARDQRASANEFSQRVWQIVRNRQCRNQKFRREHPIPPYTADFCCVALKLIIEIDGKHHQTQEGSDHDTIRDNFLARHEYEVLRIAGYSLLQNPADARDQIEAAIDRRVEQMKKRLPPAPRPRRWERGWG